MPIANINNADLWYDVMGQGEPLLLHHGYTASRVNWMPVAERLKDRYQIILIECRGAGESEHTQSGYEIAQYALDVVGLLDHLALERVAFAGHSMGGGIGFQLGVHHSARLTKLILKAAIPSGGIGPYSQELLDQQLAARRRGDRTFFLNRYHQGRTLAELEDDDWFEDRVNHLMTISDGHLAGGLETMSNLNLTAQLGNLITPTLVIAGSGDGLLNANLQDYQRLPNADLAVLSRVGHEVAVHAPDAVAEAIDKFMTYGPTAPKQPSA
jgi:pimeloyl-ACP methyl ester carboxylesterase